ncbi:MAG: L-ribulose-5-phosphate 4-epimerase [Bacteroidales bacterium]|nr:L-ribulose-5-phosphate 4-epimerase [Bacteroidales bacterium]
MLEDIKERVCRANIELFESGLVVFTWGNVSEIDPGRKFVVIKPSGVDYRSLTPDDMVVVDVASGAVAEGRLKPSSDTPTHLELYRRFESVGAVAHTHSVNAVAFAQAGMDIPALGTTHADYFFGDIPCTRLLSESEVQKDYELNTGCVIAETIISRGYDPMEIPGIVVRCHGPFTWGKDAHEAFHNAAVLEQIAEMDIKTLTLSPDASMPRYILSKHYSRKNGPDAYYGQQK